MQPSELRAKLKGIVGFGITPFYNNLEIKLEALRQHAEHLTQHSDVVIPLGHNGEEAELLLAMRGIVGGILIFKRVQILGMS